MRCVVLICALNEAPTIRSVAGAARARCDGVLVIDDGSTDGTADALDGLDVRVVRHAEPSGKGTRLAAGLDLLFAEGVETVLAMDGDGQHAADDIPRLRAASVPRGLVLGDRSGDMAAMPSGRRRSNRFGAVFISWACGRRIADPQCGMRLYTSEMWRTTGPRVLARDRRGFVFETAVLMQAAEAGVPFAFVPIRARYKLPGQRRSHFRPVLDFLLITWAVTRFLATRRLRIGKPSASAPV